MKTEVMNYPNVYRPKNEMMKVMPYRSATHCHGAIRGKKSRLYHSRSFTHTNPVGLETRRQSGAQTPMIAFPCLCLCECTSPGRIRQSVYNGEVSLSSKNQDLALLFTALADRTRLRLLNLMDGSEVCVCYFVEILGQSQPKISRHLAYLRRAGIVAARRDGKWMHYKVVAPRNAGAARILRETLSVLKEDKTMQADLSRLTKACCTPRTVSALDGAPLPIPVQSVACSPC